MKKIVFCFTAIMLPVLLLAQHIVHVPGDFQTIQQAVNAAGYGDTVLVAPGTYLENITLQGNDKTIVLASYFLFSGDTSDINNTVIDASIPQNQNYGMGILIKNQDAELNSKIIGFTITGGTGYYKTYGGGICANNATPAIEHNRILNCSVTGTQPTGAGIRIGSPTDTTRICYIKHNVIKNCTITANLVGWGAGISLGAVNAILEDNQIIYNDIFGDSTTDCGGGGIFIDNSAVFHFPHIVIKDNIIAYNEVLSFNTQGGGIAVLGGNSSRSVLNIEGNVIENNIARSYISLHGSSYAVGGGMAILSPAEGSIISNNVISENSVLDGTVYRRGGGIYLIRYATDSGDPEPLIEKNIITGNISEEGAGIFSEHIGAKIINNFISANIAEKKAAAMYLMGPGENFVTEIINNTITENQVTSEAGMIGSIYLYGYFNVLLMNNIFYNNQAASMDEMLIEFASVEMHYCDINTGEIEGEWSGHNNIYEDPMFIDGMVWDCWNPGPCWDTGKDSLIVFGKSHFAPESSMGDITRPLDEGIDMGAWEIKACYVGKPQLTGSKVHILASPNPFDDFTVIEYELGQPGDVTLAIFNNQGQKIIVLIKEQQEIGRHRLLWNAEGMPAGVYFYVLGTEGTGFRATGKLVKY